MSAVPMMLMFAGKMIGVLLLVFLLAVLTPKLAKAISSKSKKNPSPTDNTEDVRSEVRQVENVSPEIYAVNGLYDAQSPDSDSGSDCDCSSDGDCDSGCDCDSDCDCGSDSND